MMVVLLLSCMHIIMMCIIIIITLLFIMMTLNFYSILEVIVLNTPLSKTTPSVQHMLASIKTLLLLSAPACFLLFITYSIHDGSVIIIMHIIMMCIIIIITLFMMTLCIIIMMCICQSYYTCARACIFCARCMHVA